MKFLKKINRQAKVLDTRIHVKRALREAGIEVDEFFIDALTNRQLLQHNEDLYYKEVGAIRTQGGGVDNIHRMEKLELAMSLSRNLVYSEGEVHPWQQQVGIAS